MNSSNSKRYLERSSAHAASSSNHLLEKKTSSANPLKARSSSGAKRSSSSVVIKEVDANVVVCDIMKEVLDKALEKIHETYMENQTINFVVHCAQQAFEKTLRIHFYQHNIYGRSDKLWSPDKRPEPSSPDSWAFHHVPLSKNITTEPELNTLSQIKLDMAEKRGEIITDTRVDVVSLPSETLLEEVKATLDEIIDNLPVTDEREIEQSESSLSTFTIVVEGIQKYNDFEMGPQLSNISLGETPYIRLPKIDLPDCGNNRYLEQDSEILSSDRLPPIRTETSYKCRLVSPFEPTKKTKEKK